MSAHRYRLSNDFARDVSGTILTSAKLYAYVTGTTTPLDTFSDSGLSSANTNPIIADSAGKFGDIFLGSSGPYKIVLTNSAGTTQWTEDPVYPDRVRLYLAALPSVNWPGLEVVLSTDGHLYERDSTDTGWTDRGLADSIGNAASVSQVLTGTSTATVVTPDSLAAIWQRGTDIASASSLALPSGGGGVFNVTGTTTIGGIGTAQGGRKIVLKFVGACALTHDGTAFILPGAISRSTAAGDMYEFTNEAATDASGSNWRCTDYTLAAGTSMYPLNIGYISGLTLSRAGTTTYGIAVGAAASETSGTVRNLAITSAFTKTLSAWAVGTAAGSLDTGAVGASTWYHVHIIQKLADGTIDFLLSTSAGSPTMPSGYTARRRIGSILTNGSSQIVSFNQVGDEFLWDAAVVDVDAANPGTAAVLRTITTPLGVRTRAILSVGGWAQTNLSQGIVISSPDVSDQAAQAGATASLTGFSSASSSATGSTWNFSTQVVRTDTSSQVRSRLSASGAADRIGLITRGWFDDRGKA